jgi:hypothetical protein
MVGPGIGYVKRVHLVRDSECEGLGMAEMALWKREPELPLWSGVLVR